MLVSFRCKKLGTIPLNKIFLQKITNLSSKSIELFHWRKTLRFQAYAELIEHFSHVSILWYGHRIGFFALFFIFTFNNFRLCCVPRDNFLFSFFNCFFCGNFNIVVNFYPLQKVIFSQAEAGGMSTSSASSTALSWTSVVNFAFPQQFWMHFAITFAHDVARICIASKTKISFAILLAVLVSPSTKSSIFSIILQRILWRAYAFMALIMPMLHGWINDVVFSGRNIIWICFSGTSTCAEQLSTSSRIFLFSLQSWRSQFCRQFVQICDVIQAFREDLYSIGNVLTFLKQRGCLDFPMTNSSDFEPAKLLHISTIWRSLATFTPLSNRLSNRFIFNASAAFFSLILGSFLNCSKSSSFSDAVTSIRALFSDMLLKLQNVFGRFQTKNIVRLCYGLKSIFLQSESE